MALKESLDTILVDTSVDTDFAYIICHPSKVDDVLKRFGRGQCRKMWDELQARVNVPWGAWTETPRPINHAAPITG